MIYHIAIQAEWDARKDLPTYVPDRYWKDGFIHCSELQQLERLADHNLRGRSDLLLLEIQPTKLQPETRYKQGSRERYPHICGPINKDAITKTVAVPCNPDGLCSGVFDAIYLNSASLHARAAGR